jgi:hypothetical protein
MTIASVIDASVITQNEAFTLAFDTDILICLVSLAIGERLNQTKTIENEIPIGTL